jgi:DNA primase
LVARVDIVELIETRVPLRRMGRNYVACCPFHNEKAPSFTVSPEKQFYHCFGCGAHGSVIGFLMAYDQMSFVEAVHELAARTGLELPQGLASQANVDPALGSLLSQVAEFYHRKHKDYPQAVEYLKRRGLDDPIVREFQIGYAPPGWDHVLKAFGGNEERRRQLLDIGLLIEKSSGSYYDRFRDRLMFPIHDARGRVLGFGGRVLGDGTPKYLNSPETATFQKGRILYGRHQLRQANTRLERVLVVEGYMDVVGLAQHGVCYAVATLGTSTTGDQAAQLLRLAPNVVFCFDGDAAGRQAAWRAFENVLPRLHDGQQVYFMFLPEGEDPDSLVRAVGPAEFERRIAQAIPLSSFFFDTLAKKVDLTNLDGRARLVELAKPYLSNLAPGVLRQLMIDRLGELAKLQAPYLFRLLSAKVDASDRISPTPKRTGPSLVRRAISLLLHHPMLATKVKGLAWLRGMDVLGTAILVDMLELLQAQPKMTMGELLEHWRDTETGHHLDKLAVEPPVGLEADAAAIEAEFVGALRQLQVQHTGQRIEALLVKSRSTSLTPEEKHELQRLLSEQQMLQSASSGPSLPLKN